MKTSKIILWCLCMIHMIMCTRLSIVLQPKVRLKSIVCFQILFSLDVYDYYMCFRWYMLVVLLENVHVRCHLLWTMFVPHMSLCMSWMNNKYPWMFAAGLHRGSGVHCCWSHKVIRLTQKWSGHISTSDLLDCREYCTVVPFKPEVKV